MKTAFIIFTALALFCSVNIYGYVLTETQSSGSEDQSVKNTIEFIYDALFNISALSKLPAGDFNFTIDGQTQGCIDAYSVANIAILSVGGFKIRMCVHITGWELEKFINSHSAAYLKNLFIDGMVDCAADESSQEVLDCYTNVIDQVFSDISTDTVGHYTGNKDCIRTELETIIAQLNGTSAQLAQCVEQADNSPSMLFF